MGVWSLSISGNDTAMDLRSEYQAAFYAYDMETALQKIDSCVRASYGIQPDDDDWVNYYYSLADFMWKHGILTDAVRDEAIRLIDTRHGMALYEAEGPNIVRKREKVLTEFKEKLLSKQIPKKKIRVNLYMESVFETGDLIAIRLSTADRYHAGKCVLSEEEFHAQDGKYVVFRKVGEHVSYTAAVAPEVRDVWPDFQMYKKVFDSIPQPEALKGVPFAVFRDGRDVFVTQGSMTLFKRKKAAVIGKDMRGLEQSGKHSGNEMILLGSKKPWCDAETELLNRIWAK